MYAPLHPFLSTLVIKPFFQATSLEFGFENVSSPSVTSCLGTKFPGRFIERVLVLDKVVIVKIMNCHSNRASAWSFIEE